MITLTSLTEDFGKGRAHWPWTGGSDSKGNGEEGQPSSAHFPVRIMEDILRSIL